MRLGVPKEVKVHEYRVGMTPASVREVTSHGHEVVVETNAGIGIGAGDDDYRAAGAEIADTAEDVFARADMIVKVKEPQAGERSLLRDGQILFTYLHLAPDPEQTKDLVESGAICVAYETVTDAHGGLPLLAPMSQVAGRMSIQAGAHCLEKEPGGAGILIGGVPGVAPAKVVIIGGGVVGENAAYMAIGLGADVTVIERNVDTMRALVVRFGGRIKTLYSTALTIEQEVLDADLVIGGVLVPGAKAPKLVSRDQVSRMRPGSVLVDVAIDQGGCFETAKPTTHAEPTYVVDGVVHYCVANMPGAVARTSTYALNNVTLPFILQIADKGVNAALLENPHLLEGLNVYRGKVTYQAVAEDLGYSFTEPATALAA
ncbi:MAG: alanine dehydrogenase [Hyphomicrobiaceae bacterium]|nr:alanine dehydrogenase [Hyphomicrobiaceae bacterium]